MNTTNVTATATAATLKLAHQFRRGSTAAFTVKAYEAVLSLIGWTVSTEKAERKVVAVTFGSPDGSTFTVRKELHYRGFNLYMAAPFLRPAVEAVCFYLGLPTVEREEADRKMYGVKHDLTNAGTCPACFSIQKLNKGRLVLHGYTRPGDGFVYRECFGVGHLPLEVSSEGTEAFVEVLARALVNAQEALALFEAKPPTEMVVTVYCYALRRNVPETITSSDYRFLREMENMRRRLTAAVPAAAKLLMAYGNVVKNWKPDIDPAARKATRAMPVMIDWIMVCCL